MKVNLYKIDDFGKVLVLSESADSITIQDNGNVRLSQYVPFTGPKHLQYYHNYYKCVKMINTPVGFISEIVVDE